MKRENSTRPAEAKEPMRRRMRAALCALTTVQRAEASLKICRQAAELPAFRVAQMVALFAPLSTEPDLGPLIEEAWARGKKVVFPLMLRLADAPRLEWHQATGWDQLVVAGPFGIREPDPTRCPRVDPGGIGCLLVPGLAFDACGGRLGRGGGYYDSALAARAAGTVTVGIMFALQQVAEVPQEAHDQRLDQVITEE